MFMTGFVENSMSLSSVFAHVSVNELDDIVSDWGSENCWHWDAINNFVL